MNEPKVYIVILNWNQKQDTAECLQSLKKLEYGNYRIIVVDNDSQDGSFDYLKHRFPYISLIRNEENLGFAEGCNVGVKRALSEGTDYILLLNNDILVEKDLLNILIDTAEEDEKIGILGAVNYSFSQPNKLIVIGTNFNWWLGITKREKLKEIESGKIRAPQPIQGVTGSSLLIKKEVIQKIDLLDSRFFIYYEDIDWCLRAKRKGYRVLYVPEAKVLHKMETTFKISTPAILYLYTRNLPLFMFKNCPSVFLINFSISYILKIITRLILFSIKGKTEQRKAIILGLVDFLKGNFGKGHLDEFIPKNNRA